MKTRLRRILIRLHIVAFTIALLNSLLKNVSIFSLTNSLELTIELATVISGLTLFFFHLRPFKRINYYFSIYAFVTILLVIGIIVRGIFFGLILSIILFPIVPDQKEYEKEGIIISVPFQGFMSRCCSYQIKERKLFIFEKDYAILETEGPIEFNTLKIQQTKNEIELTYSLDFDEEIKKEKITK